MRMAAWLVLAAGIALSTLTDRGSSAPLETRDGFRVVTADLHVHAFLGDGAMPPSEIRREAARRGLDVVAVTNHNQMYALSVDRLLFPAPGGPVMLAGEELTTPNYHLIALGITRPVDWRLSLADAIRDVHAQGGVAIGAHPTTNFWQRLDDATLALLDGLEVAHPVRHLDPKARARIDAVYARARKVNPTIAAIGSSDYHFDAPIGYCRTRLLVRDLSIGGVFDAIRAGRTVAYDADGNAYGDSSWTAAAAAPAAIAQPRHNIAMAAAWLALMFLVMFGGSRNVF